MKINILNKKYFCLAIVFSVTFFWIQAQTIEGQQLLNNAIHYHDPNDVWKTFKSSFYLIAQRPDKESRLTALNFDQAQSQFEFTQYENENYWTAHFKSEQCRLFFNGIEEIPKETREAYGLNCERMTRYRDYYTYLIGLPMKLKDPGTQIASEGVLVEREGSTYWKLKVTYDPKVGSDTWYFYFDPKTFALKLYQFFHEESKNDGEYVILEEEIEIGGILMPKKRSWYQNSNHKYLGTDRLSKTKY